MFVDMAGNVTSEGNHTFGNNLRESEGFVAIAYCLIGAFGIVGNVLVIAVILNFRAMLSKNVNVLVLNQSLIDMLASLLIIAETHIATDTYLDGVWGDIVCRFWLNAVPLWSLLMASNVNILVITLERYVAVVHPIRYRNYSEHAKRRLTAIAMATTWLCSLAFNCAITSTTSAVRDHRCYSMMFFYNEACKKLTGLAAFLFEFLLPVAICVICYARIIHHLSQKVGPQSSQVFPSNNYGGVLNNQTKTKMIRNVHKTFGIVVLCAIVCNTGNQCLFLAFNFGYSLNFSGAAYNASVIAAFANCCVNPFVYAFKYTMFQQGLKRLFCGHSPQIGNAHSTYADCRVNANATTDTLHI